MSYNAMSIAVSAMSAASFDTIEQMNAAYEIAEAVIEKALSDQKTDLSNKAYQVVDDATWDASLATRVRDALK